MHDARELHMFALKSIMHYLQGTLDFDLHLHRSFTSGYAVLPGDNLISWSSKHQNTVSCSSVESENQVVANGVAEACLLYQLLMELHFPLSHNTLVYCVIYLASNSVQHQRMKAC
jgi:hypothetical protein